MAFARRLPHANDLYRAAFLYCPAPVKASPSPGHSFIRHRRSERSDASLKLQIERVQAAENNTNDRPDKRKVPLLKKCRIAAGGVPDCREPKGSLKVWKGQDCSRWHIFPDDAGKSLWVQILDLMWNLQKEVVSNFPHQDARRTDTVRHARAVKTNTRLIPISWEVFLETQLYTELKGKTSQDTNGFPLGRQIRYDTLHLRSVTHAAFPCVYWVSSGWLKSTVVLFTDRFPI